MPTAQRVPRIVVLRRASQRPRGSEEDEAASTLVDSAWDVLLARLRPSVRRVDSAPAHEPSSVAAAAADAHASAHSTLLAAASVLPDAVALAASRVARIPPRPRPRVRAHDDPADQPDAPEPESRAGVFQTNEDDGREEVSDADADADDKTDEDSDARTGLGPATGTGASTDPLPLSALPQSGSVRVPMPQQHSSQSAHRLKLRTSDAAAVPFESTRMRARAWTSARAACRALSDVCMGGLGTAADFSVRLRAASATRVLTPHRALYVLVDTDGEWAAFVRTYNAMARAMRLAITRHAPRARLWLALPRETFVVEAFAWVPADRLEAHPLWPALSPDARESVRDALATATATAPASSAPANATRSVSAGVSASPRSRSTNKRARTSHVVGTSSSTDSVTDSVTDTSHERRGILGDSADVDTSTGTVAAARLTNMT